VWNDKKMHGKKEGGLVKLNNAAAFLGCVRLLSSAIQRLKDTGRSRLKKLFFDTFILCKSSFKKTFFDAFILRNSSCKPQLHFTRAHTIGVRIK
jgi:hypothetical protein